MIAYDGANIRLSVESGDMGGFDGRHGYRVRPEAIQVDQESGLEDKACLKLEESPAKAGDSSFRVYVRMRLLLLVRNILQNLAVRL